MRLLGATTVKGAGLGGGCQGTEEDHDCTILAAGQGTPGTRGFSCLNSSFTLPLWRGVLAPSVQGLGSGSVPDVGPLGLMPYATVGFYLLRAPSWPHTHHIHLDDSI